MADNQKSESNAITHCFELAAGAICGYISSASPLVGVCLGAAIGGVVGVLLTSGSDRKKDGWTSNALLKGAVFGAIGSIGAIVGVDYFASHAATTVSSAATQVPTSVITATPTPVPTPVVTVSSMQMSGTVVCDTSYSTRYPDCCFSSQLFSYADSSSLFSMGPDNLPSALSNGAFLPNGHVVAIDACSYNIGKESAIDFYNVHVPSDGGLPKLVSALNPNIAEIHRYVSDGVDHVVRRTGDYANCAGDHFSRACRDVADGVRRTVPYRSAIHP